MDFVQAFKFPFDDKDLLSKGIVGTLMMIVGFFIPIIPMGYMVATARNVMREEDDPMPEGGDIGQVLADGVMAFVAGVIYALPAIPFFCFFFIVTGIAGDSEAGGPLACLGFCGMLFGMLLFIPIAAIYWMGVIRYAETGNFSSFLAVRELFDAVRNNLSTLVMLFIFNLVLGLVFSLIGSVAWITCIGIPAVAFWQQIASGHLLGQAGLEITGGGYKAKNDDLLGAF